MSSEQSPEPIKAAGVPLAAPVLNTNVFQNLLVEPIYITADQLQILLSTHMPSVAPSPFTTISFGALLALLICIFTSDAKAAFGMSKDTVEALLYFMTAAAAIIFLYGLFLETKRPRNLTPAEFVNVCRQQSNLSQGVE